MPGDAILLPNGTPHALSSEPAGPLVPWAHVAVGPGYEASRFIEVGTPPTQTRIPCASYRYDPAVSTPLFSLLPEVMHVPAGSLNPALGDTIRLIAAELASHEVGVTIVLNRLIDVVLINLIRGWLRTTPQATPVAWLRGLLDPTVAAALSALHADPARAWTVESLAAHVAVSRATFVRRFTKQVGDPPAAYLTRLRMDLAAQRLRDTDDSMETIARSCGYESVYAFCRAFVRERVLPPGRYRTHRRRASLTVVAQ